MRAIEPFPRGGLVYWAHAASHQTTIRRVRQLSLVTEGARPSSLAQEETSGHAARLTAFLLAVVVPQRVVGDQVRLRRRA